MYLSRLQLSSYRNYRFLRMEPGRQVNLLFGENAQGKTNLLEAVHYLATGQSVRGTPDPEVVYWGEAGFRIHAEVQRAYGPLQIEISFSKDKGKEIQVNGTPIERRSDLFGQFNSVFFSPDDLQLVKGGPAERRRFLDAEIAQISGEYRHALSLYQKALQQRNNLLRQSRRMRIDALLEPWDEQLIAHGIRVMRKRSETINRLSILARLMHRRLTEMRENLDLQYLSSLEIPPMSLKRDQWDLQMGGLFREGLLQKREEELLRGYTLVGPHRDDLGLSINGIEVRGFGSQGQQRTAVLSLRLAELELMRSETGEYPVLLLDDVFSELDLMRRRQLLEVVGKKVQTYVSSANEMESQVCAGHQFSVTKGTLTVLAEEGS